MMATPRPPMNGTIAKYRVGSMASPTTLDLAWDIMWTATSSIPVPLLPGQADTAPTEQPMA